MTDPDDGVGRADRILNRAHRRIFGHAASGVMRQFFGRVSWSVIGGGVAGLLLFSTTIVAGRLLGPEQFGTGAFVLLLASIIVPVGALGLDNALMRTIPRAASAGERGRLLASAIFPAATSLVVAGAMVWILRGQIARLVHVEADAIAVAAPLIFVIGLKIMLDRAMSGLERFRFQSLVRPTEGAMSLLVLCVLAFVFDSRDYRTLAIASGSGAAVLATVYVIRLWRELSPASIDVASFRRLFRYGMITVLSVLTPVGYTYVDKVMVSRELGATELGVYLAYYTASFVLVNNVVALLLNVLFPMVARVDDKAVIVAKLERLLVVGVVPGAIVVALVLRGVLALLGGEYPVDWTLIVITSSWSSLYAFTALYTVVTVAHSEQSFLRVSMFQLVRSVLFVAIVAALAALDRLSLATVFGALLFIEVLELTNNRYVTHSVVLRDDASSEKDAGSDDEQRTTNTD